MPLDCATPRLFVLMSTTHPRFGYVAIPANLRSRYEGYRDLSHILRNHTIGNFTPRIEKWHGRLGSPQDIILGKRRSADRAQSNSYVFLFPSPYHDHQDSLTSRTSEKTTSFRIGMISGPLRHVLASNSRLTLKVTCRGTSYFPPVGSEAECDSDESHSSLTGRAKVDRTLHI